MHFLNYPETTKWVVAHNNNNVFHMVKVGPDKCISTGQPFMDIFDSEEELLAQFPQLANNEELTEEIN